MTCSFVYFFSVSPAVLSVIRKDSFPLITNAFSRIINSSHSVTLSSETVRSLENNNNNNNNPICKAPECQKTSVALADRNSRSN